MDMLRLLPRYALRPAKKVYRRLFGGEQWFLIVNAGRPLADSVMTGREAAAQVKIHRAPRGRFWADPFPIVVDGKVWVFFEDYSFRSKKAIIACAPVSADGELGEVAPRWNVPTISPTRLFLSITVSCI